MSTPSATYSWQPGVEGDAFGIAQPGVAARDRGCWSDVVRAPGA